MFQPEDEKELEEKFSDKHRKRILKPQEKKKKKKSGIIFDHRLIHYSFVLLIKMLISETNLPSRPSTFFIFISF